MPGAFDRNFRGSVPLPPQTLGTTLGVGWGWSRRRTCQGPPHAGPSLPATQPPEGTAVRAPLTRDIPPASAGRVSSWSPDSFRCRARALPSPDVRLRTRTARAESTETSRGPRSRSRRDTQRPRGGRPGPGTEARPRLTQGSPSLLSCFLLLVLPPLVLERVLERGRERETT